MAERLLFFGVLIFYDSIYAEHYALGQMLIMFIQKKSSILQPNINFNV